MSSFFKYPGQTAPIKIGPVNAQVRHAKPAKREKGKKRREENAGERSSPGDGSHFRVEETRGGRERQREREREREIKRGKEGRRGREENSSRNGNNFRCEGDRARARAKEKGRGEARAYPPDSPHGGILFRREREAFAEEERKRRKRE